MMTPQACTVTTYREADTSFVRATFGTQSQIQELIVDTKDKHIKLAGYSADQKEAIRAAAAAAVKALLP